MKGSGTQGSAGATDTMHARSHPREVSTLRQQVTHYYENPDACLRHTYANLEEPAMQEKQGNVACDA